jgi:hypothetical protein
MAANSNYQDGEKKEAAKQARLMWVCPACKKTVDMSRRYCNCHADLREAATIASVNSPEVGPCNFEAPGLTCYDCPEDCMYCPSFDSPVTNSAGFGGQNCRHNKTGTAKCCCCQAQIKIGIDWQAHNISFSRLAMKVMEGRRANGQAENLAGKNIWFEAADFISEEMKKPVLNRIKQRLDRAG